jgi:hypothetical protein
MRETVIVNQEEQGRMRVLVEVVGGRMTVGQAAETMQLSVRHTDGSWRRIGRRAL